MGLFSRLLGNSKPESPQISDDEREEIIHDLASEMAKHIQIGNGTDSQVPPVEESQAYKRFVNSGLELREPPRQDPGTLVDYDQIFKDVIARLPVEFAPVLTTIGNVDPICPYCNAVFPKKPKAKTKCKSCGKAVYVRTRPLDGVKVLVTDAQTDQISLQETVKDGLYFSTRNMVKEQLKHFQDAAYPGWKFVGVCDERSPLEELEYHNRIIKRRSPEEEHAIGILCRTDVRACATAWFGE